MLVEVVTTFFFIWFLWYIFKTFQERRQMPPGPFPLPLIGNTHQVGFDPISAFDKFCEKYGNVFTVTFPIGTVVVVNSVELAREVLVTKKDDMAGRPTESYFPTDVIFGGRDIACADYGPPLMFRRKVFKSAMHFFGSGMEQAEERMGNAVKSLLKEIEVMEGQPFSIRSYAFSAVVIQLWQWLSSNEFSFGHPTINSLAEFNKKVAVLVGQGSIYQMFPSLAYLPCTFKTNLNRVLNIKEEILGGELQAHRETYTPGVIRDLIDSFISAYIEEMAKETNKNEIGSIEDIKGLMVDVVFAGGDTTASFIDWLVLYMALNQHVQQKIHAELDRVVGKDRLPRWKDVQNLPYLEATICEVMRHSSFAPIAGAHKAIRDTAIGSYRIPKGTIVLINLHRIHHSSNEWTEATSFKPDRFLDANGMFVGWTKYPSFMPFSVGRRSCVGEAVAKMQMFMFASSLLHRFKFETVQGEAKPTIEAAEFAVAQVPKDYKVVPRKRV